MPFRHEYKSKLGKAHIKNRAGLFICLDHRVKKNETIIVNFCFSHSRRISNYSCKLYNLLVELHSFYLLLEQVRMKEQKN